MKKLMLSLVFATASYANAADVIARYQYSVGFSIKPGTETVEIYDNGNVKYVGSFYDRETGEDVVTKLTLAKLNKERVEKLIAYSKDLKESDLIDLNEGEPHCTDFPSTAFTVVQAGTEVVVGRESGCHTWVNYNARVVKELLEGLANLATLK